MYIPNPVDNPLYEELKRINEDMISGQESFKLDELNAAPSRPRNGVIVYADGTNWNPGSGEGFYGYQAGAWVKL